MWINRAFFDMVTADNKRQQTELHTVHSANDVLVGEHLALKTQKAKDDLLIDWLKHRVNALEKEKGALLLAKGIHLPIPEIVPNRPGSMSVPPSLDSMPDFEDVGDEKAKALGIVHTEDGTILYTS